MVPNDDDDDMSDIMSSPVSTGESRDRRMLRAVEVCGKRRRRTKKPKAFIFVKTSISLETFA